MMCMQTVQSAKVPSILARLLQRVFVAELRCSEPALSFVAVLLSMFLQTQLHRWFGAPTPAPVPHVEGSEVFSVDMEAAVDAELEYRRSVRDFVQDRARAKLGHPQSASSGTRSSFRGLFFMVK